MSAELPARPGESLFIVGAGIIGVASALTFARQGFRVTVIDPNEPGSGASHGNAGGIAPIVAPLSQPDVPFKVPGMLFDPDGPFSIRPGQFLKAMPWFLRFLAECGPGRTEANSIALYELTRHAPTAWREFARGTAAQDLLRETGWLKIYSTKKSFDHSAFDRELLDRRGAAYEVLSPDELRQLEPNLAPNFHAGMLYTDGMSVPNPRRMVETLAQEAQSLGTVFLREAVNDLSVGEDGYVALETSAAIHKPDCVMICAGAYSGPLATKLGAGVMLEAERGYHAMFETPEKVITRPIMWVDQSMVLAPMETGVRLSTQSEFGGLDGEPRYDRLERLSRNALEMLPNLVPEAKEQWMGRRPATPDSLPYLGVAPATPRAYLNFGHNHLGLTLSAISARVALEDWTRSATSVAADMVPYRATR